MDEAVQKVRRRLARLREMLKTARNEADRQTLRLAIAMQQRAMVLALRSKKDP